MLVKINIFRLKQNKPVGWRDLISSTVRFVGARDFKGAALFDEMNDVLPLVCFCSRRKSQSGPNSGAQIFGILHTTGRDVFRSDDFDKWNCAASGTRGSQLHIMIIWVRARHARKNCSPKSSSADSAWIIEIYGDANVFHLYAKCTCNFCQLGFDVRDKRTWKSNKNLIHCRASMRNWISRLYWLYVTGLNFLSKANFQALPYRYLDSVFSSRVCQRASLCLDPIPV